MAVATAGTAVAVTGMAAAAIGAAVTLGAAVAVGMAAGTATVAGTAIAAGAVTAGAAGRLRLGRLVGPRHQHLCGGYGRRCWSPAYGYYPCRYRYGWGY